MIAVQKINITQFRNYEALRLDTGGAPVVVLTGANGSGKTNILEAVSLLFPGRGLRGASLPEMLNRDAETADVWGVSADIETISGENLRIGTAPDQKLKRRVVRIGGKDALSASALAAHISMVWLTPQMDRIFLEGAAARRKFLDRLVFSFDPAHAGRLNRYDKNLRERMRLLQGDRAADPRWIDTLERQLAEDSVAIGHARKDLLTHLSVHVFKDGVFPAPAFGLSGWVDAALDDRPAVDVEEDLRALFSASRGRDAAAGKTHEGVHRTDFLVFYADKDMAADQCSTGEQKGLLVSTVLAHAQMMRAEKGFAPMLLLDEVAAHLDDLRRDRLFTHLKSFGSQVWLTGTDTDIFREVSGSSVHFTVDRGRVTGDGISRKVG